MLGEDTLKHQWFINGYKYIYIYILYIHIFNIYIMYLYIFYIYILYIIYNIVSGGIIKFCWEAKVNARLYLFHLWKSHSSYQLMGPLNFSSTTRREKYFMAAYLFLDNFIFEWLLILPYSDNWWLHNWLIIKTRKWL